jgi:hypothetical protein
MKNKKLAAFIAIILGAVSYFTIPIKSIDRDFNEHYKSFMGLYNQHCPERKIPLQFKLHYRRLNGSMIGLCTRRPGSAVVAIDPIYWMISNDLVQKQLMYHELTHCLLDVAHIIDPRRSHYMGPYMEDLTEEELLEQTVEIMKEVCRVS